jgi:hypothetical protein
MDGSEMTTQRGITVRGALMALGAVVLPACSLILSTDPQCSSNADCTSRGAAFAKAVCSSGACVAGGSGDGGSDPWACLDNPQAVPPATVPVKVSMTFFDPVSQGGNRPIAGVAVRGCTTLDVGCGTPVFTSVTSDETGTVTFTLPAQFDGYLEMSATSIFPALWYFAPPPQEDTHYNVSLLSPQAFTGIAQTVGTTVDPNLGHTFNIALDCAKKYGQFAKGVTFKAQATNNKTRAFYQVGGLPSTTATTTDSSGVGGFANVTPGSFAVTAELDGRRTGSVNVLVRAGVITYAPIPPGP